MNKEELDFILQEGEGLNLEFKESFDKSLAKEIVAFANTEGGRIFLGINDGAEIKRINATNKLKSQIMDIARNCDPSIDIELESFDKILIIDVKEGDDKPYSCSLGFYLRQGANSQKMKRNEIINAVIREGKASFDRLINKEFDFNKDFDKNKLKNFLEKAKIKTNLSRENILINLGAAIKKGNLVYLNNAGVLFFSKDLNLFFSQAYTTCVRYKGETRTNVIDRIDLKGDLIEQVEESVKFLLKNTRLAYKFTGKPAREEIPEYPTDAIREAIINAIMHRDYFEGGSNVYLNIYSDRIEVISPGGLFKITKKELGKKASRRNEIIANLFHRIGIGEKLGSGIKRMNELMVEDGLLKPKFDISKNFFEVDFYGPGEAVLGSTEKVGEKDLETTQKTTQKTTQRILELIKENPQITRNELSNIIGISENGIKFHITNLKKKGLLKRVGADKGGHWEVKFKE